VRSAQKNPVNIQEDVLDFGGKQCLAEQKGVGNTIDCSKRAEKPTETLTTQANCLKTIWGGGAQI